MVNTQAGESSDFVTNFHILQANGTLAFVRLKSILYRLNAHNKELILF